MNVFITFMCYTMIRRASKIPHLNWNLIWTDIQRKNVADKADLETLWRHDSMALPKTQHNKNAHCFTANDSETVYIPVHPWTTWRWWSCTTWLASARRHSSPWCSPALTSCSRTGTTSFDTRAARCQGWSQVRTVVIEITYKYYIYVLRHVFPKSWALHVTNIAFSYDFITNSTRYELVTEDVIDFFCFVYVNINTIVICDHAVSKTFNKSINKRHIKQHKAFISFF